MCYLNCCRLWVCVAVVRILVDLGGFVMFSTLNCDAWPAIYAIANAYAVIVSGDIGALAICTVPNTNGHVDGSNNQFATDLGHGYDDVLRRSMSMIEFSKMDWGTLRTLVVIDSISVLIFSCCSSKFFKKHKVGRVFLLLRLLPVAMILLLMYRMSAAVNVFTNVPIWKMFESLHFYLLVAYVVIFCITSMQACRYRSRNGSTNL